MWLDPFTQILFSDWICFQIAVSHLSYMKISNWTYLICLSASKSTECLLDSWSYTGHRGDGHEQDKFFLEKTHSGWQKNRQVKFNFLTVDSHHRSNSSPSRYIHSTNICSKPTECQTFYWHIETGLRGPLREFWVRARHLPGVPRLLTSQILL